MFQNNLMMAAAGAGPDPITLSQTHNAGAAGLATQSFSSCDIGTAADNRKVVVCAFSGYGGPDNSGTPTIAGEDATWDAGGDSHTTDNFVLCAIFSANIATGTSATITFPTFSTGGRYFGAIIVYAVYGAGAVHATADSDEDTPPPMSASIEIPAHGVLIGGAGYQYGSASPTTTFTWNNATRDFQGPMSSGFANNQCTGAHRIVEAAETPTITCLPSNASAYDGRAWMQLVSYVNDN
jgi:hypothetical protein